jgi:type I restriction enzyme M protein
MAKSNSLLNWIPNDNDNDTNHYERFRKLCYHLYSNSSSSRAESIFEDVAKILLIKMLADRSKIDVLKKFSSKSMSASETLLPLLMKEFPDLIGPYDRFLIGDDLVRDGLTFLEDINLADSSSSVLGEAFQALIGRVPRGDKGQFFTPLELVKMMVNIAGPKEHEKVVDPAAGTGGFLLETHIYRKNHSSDHGRFGHLIGIEKDRDLQRLGGAIIRIATSGTGKIELGNSLDISFLARLEPSPLDADIVLTNPPFGSKIGITDEKLLHQYKLGHEWVFAENEGMGEQRESLRKSQDPQILFLELSLLILKPGGMLGIVLPEGIFGNRKTGYIWDFVRKIGRIEAMVDCPRTTFQPSTDTKTNVVFIRKNKDYNNTPNRAWIAVSKNCGHDRRGRTKSANGEPIPNDFGEIGNSYSVKDKKWWSDCLLSDAYYLVPRFYHQQAVVELSALAKKWEGKLIPFHDLVSSGAVTVRKGKEVGAETYGSGDVPFIRTSDIANLEVSVTPTNGVSHEVFKSVQKAQALKPGDILLVVDGRYKIGRSAILHRHNCHSVVQSHFLIITVNNSSPVDCYELLYILNCPEVLSQMRNLVFIQSTLGSIGKRMGELMLPIPKRTKEWENRVGIFRRALETRAKILDQEYIFA